MSRLHHKHFVPVAPLPREPDLFELPAQRIDTSIEAARRIRGRAARDREAVYLWIKVSNGATDGEICAGLGMNPSTERPRRRELEGNAPWAPGLPARIQRSPDKRHGMRIYTIAGVAPRHSGNP